MSLTHAPLCCYSAAARNDKSNQVYLPYTVRCKGHLGMAVPPARLEPVPSTQPFDMSPLGSPNDAAFLYYSEEG